MASTNKTTNYELSQFLGSDKPAWLGDYNTDMAKIDAQMKLNADAASGADGKATSNGTAIGTLANLTTDAKTDLVSAINEVDGHADTAQNTATNASTTANGCATKITALEDYLDLDTFTTPTITYSGCTERSTGTSVTCASNTGATLGKIYGQIKISQTQATSTVSFPTPFRPTTALTINGIAYHQWSDSPNNASSFSVVIPNSLEIATDGTASITIDGGTSGRARHIFINASLLFIKSFGDIPVEE